MKSFNDWFDELTNGNQIWAEQISMHHKPKTFEDCARKVYNQYLASEVFPPMQVARGYVGNVIAKVQPDKTYSKDWVTKALQKHEEEKKAQQTETYTKEHADKCAAEALEIIRNSKTLNYFPKVTHKQAVEEGDWIPKKDAPWPVTTPEEAYVRDRHFEWIKNNFEAKTGYKLPSWISEEDWNVIYDDQHLNGKGL